MVEAIAFAKPELEQKIDSKLPKKILCILEGQLELRYIYKLFQLNGYKNKCNQFDTDCIKLSWGNTKKIRKCNFEGGDIKDFPTPTPALESLNKEVDNLWLYEYIIVLFDLDRDVNNIVESKIIDKNIPSLILLASDPCFESTLIDYCYCGLARQNIESIADTNPPCKKFKDNFSKLGCFIGVNHLVKNLEYFSTKNIKLNSIRFYVDEFNKKYCISKGKV